RQIIAAVLFACCSAAVAQQAEPCRPDLEKFCKGVKPGGGRLVECLKQHESELSGGCRAKLEEGKKRGAEAKERVDEFAEACKADAQKVCQGVQPGEGRVLNCLADNKDKVSPACRQKIEEGERKHPCYEDSRRFC